MTSSAALSTLTWSEYCEKVGIADVLTAGANACYAAKSARPEAFLAEFFMKNTTAHVVDGIDAVEAADGNGGYTANITVKLTSGRTSRQVVSTTPFLGFHPSTARKLCASSVPRQSTPLPPVAPAAVNPKDAAAKPKPVVAAPQQRYDTIARVLSTSVNAAMIGKSVVDQQTCDEVLFTADGTTSLSTLLSPTIAALSLSVARLGAAVLQVPLYKHIASLGCALRFPVPGTPNHLKHAAFYLPRPIVTMLSTEPRLMGKVRIREVCLIPTLNATTPSSAAAAVAVGAEGQCAPFAALSPKMVQQLHAVYEFLMARLEEPATSADGSIRYNGYDTPQQAIELIEEAVRDSNSGLVLGADVQVGLVIDSSLCFRPDTQKYVFVEGTEYSGAQLAELLAQLVRDKKVAYIEDSHHELDTNELRRLMHRVGATATIAGQHIFAGDTVSIEKGAKDLIANNMVIRLCDHGTVSNAISNAARFLTGYPGATLSITTDTNEGDGASIADVAVGVGARYLRVGGLLRSEHAATLSRLVAIQRELEEQNVLIPPPLFEGFEIALPPAPLEPVAEVSAKDAKKKK